MEKERLKIGFEIRKINNLFRRHIEAIQIKQGLDEVTMMHGWILGFLHRNADKDIFQKDIEANFGLARSSVTCVLKTMESKGYLKREAVDHDARLKKIVLTQKGLETHLRTIREIDKFDSSIVEKIDPDDLEVFYKVIKHLEKQLEESK